MSGVSRARMLWQRLPTFFPNIKLVMYPLSPTEHRTLTRTGDLSEARFKTTPDVGKLEIREFLEKVYNLPVVSVDTVIIQGKKKRRTVAQNTRILTQTPDFKKVWVQFAPGRVFPIASTASERSTQIAKSS